MYTVIHSSIVIHTSLFVPAKFKNVLQACNFFNSDFHPSKPDQHIPTPTRTDGNLELGHAFSERWNLWQLFLLPSGIIWKYVCHSVGDQPTNQPNKRPQGEGWACLGRYSGVTHPLQCCSVFFHSFYFPPLVWRYVFPAKLPRDIRKAWSDWLCGGGQPGLMRMQ